MKKIENKEEVLKRLNELRVGGEFREPCYFCGHEHFLINENFLEIGEEDYVHCFCPRCGYSMFLNYNVFMGKIKYE